MPLTPRSHQAVYIFIVLPCQVELILRFQESCLIKLFLLPPYVTKWSKYLRVRFELKGRGVMTFMRSYYLAACDGGDSVTHGLLCRGTGELEMSSSDADRGQNKHQDNSWWLRVLRLTSGTLFIINQSMYKTQPEMDTF